MQKLLAPVKLHTPGFYPIQQLHLDFSLKPTITVYGEDEATCLLTHSHRLIQ